MQFDFFALPDHVRAMARKKAVRLTCKEDLSIAITADRALFTAKENEWWDAVVRKENVGFIYSAFRAVEDGLKIVQPSDLDFRMLEMTDVNLSVADYAQPFPTYVLRFPKGYREFRSIAPGKLAPVYAAVMCHEVAAGCIYMCLLGENRYTSTLSIHSPDGTTIEDWLGRLATAHGSEGWLWHLARASLNVSLLLDEYGVRRVGPEDPVRYARLREMEEKARKTSPRVAAIHRSARTAMGTVYTFDNSSTVDLYKKETTQSPSPGADGGGSVKPHWRRGHYRMQQHGPGRTQRKRVRIKPVFVNSHLFSGSLEDSVRLYNLPG